MFILGLPHSKCMNAGLLRVPGIVFGSVGLRQPTGFTLEWRTWVTCDFWHSTNRVSNALAPTYHLKVLFIVFTWLAFETLDYVWFSKPLWNVGIVFFYRTKSKSVFGNLKWFRRKQLFRYLRFFTKRKR